MPRPISLCDGPLRVGDFNGDCVLDVAAGGAIMLNDGHGNFPTRNNLPDLGVDLLVRDFNQDGKPDLLFAAQDESFAAERCRSSCTETAAVRLYRRAFVRFRASSCTMLAGGNFDGDGRPGVAGFAFRADAGPLYCFSNEDGGSLAFEAAFADPVSDAGGLPASFAAADLAGVGHAALVYGEASNVIALPDPARGSARDAILHWAWTPASPSSPSETSTSMWARRYPRGRRSRLNGSSCSRDPIFVADEGFSLDVLWTGFIADGGQLLAGRLQSVPTNLPPTFPSRSLISMATASQTFCSWLRYLRCTRSARSSLA